MDIVIDDGMLSRLIAEVRSLSPEEAKGRLDRHREGSIGVRMRQVLPQTSEDSYLTPTRENARVDWDDLDFGSELTFAPSNSDVDAANDDRYAIAA